MENQYTILVSLCFPLFSDHQAGGAQSHISLVLPKLAKQGFKFIVLCPFSDKYNMFSSENVTVYPILRDLSSCSNINDYMHNFKKYKKYESQCNLIWTIDRDYPLHTNKPVILSSNAFCYPNEIKALISKNISAITVLPLV